MKKEWLDVISDLLGVEPVFINSADFSAQNRQRYYWTNLPIKEWTPVTIDMVMKDILQNDQIPFEFYVRRDRQESYAGGNQLNPQYRSQANTIHDVEKKAPCLTSGPHGYCYGYVKDTKGFRMVTPTECERLQTVPEGYTATATKTNRYKMLGNGWTIDVIAHIFSSLAVDTWQQAA